MSRLSLINPFSPLNIHNRICYNNDGGGGGDDNGGVNDDMSFNEAFLQPVETRVRVKLSPTKASRIQRLSLVKIALLITQWLKLPRRPMLGRLIRLVRQLKKQTLGVGV